MIPEGHAGGQGWRALLAGLAFAVTALAIYTLFQSGFGRPHPPSAGSSYVPAPPLKVTPGTSRPAAAAAAPPEPLLAVVSDDFWLTYLPRGLERSGGGAVAPETGVEGGWARYGTPGRYVEVEVEHGTVAADWDAYRARITVLDARETTVRGRPAVVGRHPRGGKVIAWLERPGTGAWVRVSDSLGGELLAIAASARAPVGD
ncbi:hypothetical protein ACIBIZ_19510 [Nonomuraea spiralis]|uniref:hypothetical protein n=1 Tax=Nonomuraea TaxID=83681 RepID=UPI000F782C37|nr:hypothetical protein [Nonomuraea sp. WAC 01424]RSN01807.1 hypothetical protein DMB42_37160 [Nonomuraea sp. WAC 01424]